MRLRDTIREAADRFRRDESASLSIETVIIFPLLVWVYLGMFTYFDAFRSQSLSDKAAYTIADMVSRETDYITPSYIDTLYELHGLMTRSNERTQMRITLVRWNDNQDKYVKVWSRRKGGAPGLTNTELQSEAYRSRMPDGLNHQERLILVETWTIYEPVFDLGFAITPEWTGNFGAVSFDTFTVVRPRFAPPGNGPCWNPGEDGTIINAKC